MPQVEEVLPTADSGDSGQHVQNAVKYLQSEIELLKGKKT